MMMMMMIVIIILMLMLMVVAAVMRVLIILQRKPQRKLEDKGFGKGSTQKKLGPVGISVCIPARSTTQQPQVTGGPSCWQNYPK